MLINEIISSGNKPVKLGRAFNHIEDFVFFYGAAGAREAVEHLKELTTDVGSSSLRMKFDGNPTIYFGRDKDGKFVMAGHNGWGRKKAPKNPDELYNFISHESGNPLTTEDQEKREKFAKEFSDLWPLFEKATPKSFRGYVYADALFLKRPPLDDDGVYNFSPNPHSNTSYHVRAVSDLGRRIKKADIMVVGHAYFSDFGQPDAEQHAISDFSQFNSNDKLIVMGPVYNRTSITLDPTTLNNIEHQANHYENDIDGFLAGGPGISDLKQIIYRYMNTAAKQKRLGSISREDFMSKLSGQGVSEGKRLKIQELDKKFPQAISGIIHLVKLIQDEKDDIINQVENGDTTEDIWDTHGEGRVRYADDSKQFGHVKLVPRHSWTPK